MPHLRLETTVARDKIPKEFPRELLHVVAETLGKPVEVCVVTVVPDQIIVQGTTEGHCAQATLMSVGKLGETENIRHSKALADKVAEIGVDSKRFYITFNDTLAYNVGVAGTTAKEREGKK